MRPQPAVVRLSLLIAVLALVAAGAGLYWQDGPGPSTFTTLRGQTVELYGRGLYRYDTVLMGAGNRALDAVVLVLGVPLLLLSTWGYRRGSPRAALRLTGTLAYFLYVYVSYVLGVAYNELFLLYVALFSASLYGFVNQFASVRDGGLGRLFTAKMPRRGPGLFMLASGVLTLLIWGLPVIAGLVAGEPPPGLDSYTTRVTEGLDLAIITPATIMAGLMILRRAPLGYLIAFAVLVIEVMLLPQIVAQTAAQLAVGVSFTPAEIVGPISGFAILSGLATWVMVGMLRTVPAVRPRRRRRTP